MPPSLTREELQELNRTVRSPVGRRLLWEVHRLRAIVLRADQLDLMIRDDRGITHSREIMMVADILREHLDREPVVKEDRERQDLLLLRRKGGPRL